MHSQPAATADWTDRMHPHSHRGWVIQDENLEFLERDTVQTCLNRYVRPGLPLPPHHEHDYASALQNRLSEGNLQVCGTLAAKGKPKGATSILRPPVFFSRVNSYLVLPNHNIPVRQIQRRPRLLHL